MADDIRSDEPIDRLSQDDLFVRRVMREAARAHDDYERQLRELKQIIEAAIVRSATRRTLD